MIANDPSIIPNSYFGPSFNISCDAFGEERIGFGCAFPNVGVICSVNHGVPFLGANIFALKDFCPKSIWVCGYLHNRFDRSAIFFSVALYNPKPPSF